MHVSLLAEITDCLRRSCVGRNLANMELLIIVSSILRRYDFVLQQPDKPVRLLSRVSADRSFLTSVCHIVRYHGRFPQEACRMHCWYQEEELVGTSVFIGCYEPLCTILLRFVSLSVLCVTPLCKQKPQIFIFISTTALRSRNLVCRAVHIRGVELECLPTSTANDIDDWLAKCAGVCASNFPIL